MRASILTIGNEILKGKTINTNMAHIGRVLTYAGYDVRRCVIVSDEPDEIDWGLKTVLPYSDLVVTSGGLGPTYDDMTIECVSRSLNLKTAVDEAALAELKERYLDRGLELTEERLKMVRLPIGSRGLRNPVGAAPGVMLDYGGKRIVILPGVPREMESILDSIIDEIKADGRAYYEETFPLEGIMESSISPLITKTMKEWAGKVYIKSHPQKSEIEEPRLEIEVSSYDSSQDAAKKNVESVVEIIKRNYLEYSGK